MSTDIIKAQWQDGQPFLTLRHADTVGRSNLEVTIHMDASELPADREAATDALLGMAINRLYMQLTARTRMRGEPSLPGPWEGDAVEEARVPMPQK